jgi:acyl dehydratase
LGELPHKAIGMSPAPDTSLELGTHLFEQVDQRRFAALSGDVNPMHMDPLAARRLLSGRQVVHGMHTLLILLDRWIAATEQPVGALRCDFNEPICVGDRARFTFRRTEGRDVLAASVGGIECTTVTPRPERAQRAKLSPPPMAPCPDHAPLDLEPASWVGRSLSLPLATLESAAAFPHASAHLGERPVRALTALSYLVGMICPGMNSIFSSVDVAFDPEAGEALVFEVTRYDSRFRLMTVSLHGATVGTLKAFVRPPPQAQAATSELLGTVGAREFAGTRSLVVGGSRGLGELTAKLIAAGGGNVLVTYASGQGDAQGVADDINRAGRGACTIAPYRLGQPFSGLVSGAVDAPHAVYYYATPKIFRKSLSVFDRAVFDEFIDAYVVHFAVLCTWLDSLGAAHRIRVYFPSSVAIDDRPRGMTEYAMAKAAGEHLIVDLRANLKHVEIITTRLPRLATDQTSTLATVKTTSNVEVLLPIVRRMLVPMAEKDSN